MSQFSEIFKVEMDGWCYGLERYPGEVYPGLVHVVIREFKDLLRKAIEAEHEFDVLELGENISKAAKYVIDERDAAFAILAQLPNPVDLTAAQQKTLKMIVDPVEQRYGGAIERLKHKWAFENQQARLDRTKAA